MVASWRAKIAISSAETFFFERPSSRFLDFLRILITLMPCLRSWAFASARFLPGISPLIFCPRRLVPSYTKLGSSSPFFAAMSILYGYSLVTRLISCRLVMPSITFFRPERRRLSKPARADASAIWIALPSSIIIRAISGVTFITS